MCSVYGLSSETCWTSEFCCDMLVLKYRRVSDAEVKRMRMSVKPRIGAVCHEAGVLSEDKTRAAGRKTNPVGRGGGLLYLFKGNSLVQRLIHSFDDPSMESASLIFEPRGKQIAVSYSTYGQPNADGNQPSPNADGNRRAPNASGSCSQKCLPREECNIIHELIAYA